MRRYLARTMKVTSCLAVLFFFASCNDDDGPGAEQLRLQELTATWVLGSVTNDGNDVSDQFTGFSLTVDQFNFTTQNGGNAWPQSGTYSFIENDLERPLRSDGVEIIIDTVSTEDLVLSFQVTSVAGGRQEGVTGQFIFSLKKQ